MSELSEQWFSVIEVSMKHYGFIMPSTLASELNMSLKDAKKILDEFVSSGEARQLKTPFGKIYDIPSVRIFFA